MINRVVLTGRLTKNIELRHTQNGKPVASVTLAVERSFKSEGQADADFINCTVWGKSAETMSRFLSKGSLIGVDGKLQSRSYEDQYGIKTFVTEVLIESFTFLETKH